MENLGLIIKSIKDLELKKRKLGNHIRNTKYFLDTDNEVLENFIFKKTQIDFLENTLICGIDGGLVKSELHGIDLILTRAIAVFFLFKNKELVGTEYFPSKVPVPEIKTFNSIDRREFEISSSLFRAEKEVFTALKALDKDPNILLMDGSIVPHHLDKPSKKSNAVGYYENLIFLYKSLYEKALKKKVLLAGVVEDSRSRAFCEILRERVFSKGPYSETISKCVDTGILYYVLNQGERTPVFKYCKNLQEHPTLKTIKAGEEIYSFYFKTVKEDSPIRVDFLSLGDPVKTAEKISSIIFPISATNSLYGIPSVLIEADQRAKLSSSDLELVKRTLISKVGPFSGLRELRRNRRPFG